MAEDFDPNVFTDVLIGDVAASQERLNEEDSLQNRRDLIRTALAGIEGLLWFLKTQVFEVCRRVPGVTSYELDALFERSYSVAENGAVRSTARYLSTLTTFRLLHRVISRDFPGFEIDFTSIGWSRVNTAIAVRHRLMHPKGVDDLNVSTADAAAAAAAFFWTLAFVLRAASAGAFGQRKQG